MSARPLKIPESVLVVIHTTAGDVLLLERADHPGFWQSVTGSLDSVQELPESACRREVLEETGLDVDEFVLTDWRHTNRYEIYLHWRHRYAPGVTHNVEHVFGLELPEQRPIALAPREHLSYQWLPWRQAAHRCFSWTNVLAVQRLGTRLSRSGVWRMIPMKSARGSPSRASRRDRAQGQIRIATYNIHKGVVREFFGLQRIARVHELRSRLHELDADLICLQEVQGRNDRYSDRFEHWPSEPQDQFLANSPDLKRTFESAYGKNATYLHGHHGNALLSSFPIVRRENRDVSDHVMEKRGILHCVVRVGSRQIHLFVVHFGLFARSRARQTDVLIEWVRKVVPADAPLLIAGDFNDWRERLSSVLSKSLNVTEVFDHVSGERAVAQRVAYFMHDRLSTLGMSVQRERFRLPRAIRTARTFPALVPWLRMDRIYQRGFEIVSVGVPRGIEWARISDHSPLIADLRLIPVGSGGLDHGPSLD